MSRTISWSDWEGIQSLNPRNFTCGYCGCYVGSSHGYACEAKSFGRGIKIIVPFIYVCTNCGIPTTFLNANQYPDPLLGRDIKHLPEDIEQLYKEMRKSCKTSHTAVSLLGRKLIMHLAVERANADEGKSFAEYIDHLKASNNIPPDAEELVRYIKEMGNEQNHTIKIGKKEESEKILKLVEILLIFMYELKNEFSQKDEDGGK